MSYSYDFQNYSFICPHCQTYCSHNTLPIVSEIYRNERVRDLLDPRDNRHEVGFMNFAKLLPGSYLCICECQKCGRHSLMKNGQLEWPKPVGVPASKHMPDLVQQPYDEAQKVLDDSPWAACILLRIALERLCDHLGGTGANLFKRIESLSLNASEQAI